MKVSLIIPIFNQKENLQLILLSASEQIAVSMNDFEVILVDDGSNEELGDVQKQYPMLKINMVKHDENQGRSAARNTGAKVAKGEVLVFSDGDRFLSPRFLAKHYDFHLTSESAVLIGDILEVFIRNSEDYFQYFPQMFYDKNNSIWRFIRRYNYAEQVLKIYCENNGETNSLTPWISLFSGNFSIRRKDYEYVGGFDESFKTWGYENIEFGYKLYMHGIKFHYEKEAANFHIYHAQKRTIEQNYLRLKEKYKGVTEIENFIDFLDGKISIYDISRSGKCRNKEKDIYFKKNQLGSRYKPEWLNEK